MRIKQKRIWQRDIRGGQPPRGPHFRLRGVALVGVLAIFCLTFGLAIADQQPGSMGKGFKTALEYCDPPHELQVKTYLEGSESDVTNGVIVIWNAKLRTFHDDGTTEMLMNAPQCIYDYAKKVVSSSGPLQVQTWDDKNKRALHLQGNKGFYWQQTNSLLIVSNRQLTTISGSLTNSFTP